MGERAGGGGEGEDVLFLFVYNMAFCKVSFGYSMNESKSFTLKNHGGVVGGFSPHLQWPRTFLILMRFGWVCLGRVSGIHTGKENTSEMGIHREMGISPFLECLK